MLLSWFLFIYHFLLSDTISNTSKNTSENKITSVAHIIIILHIINKVTDTQKH